MSEISVNLGVVQIPENRIWKILCWLPKKLIGIQGLDHKLDSIMQHVGSVTDILHIIVADVSERWDTEKRERVQRIIANFRLVSSGLATVKVKGNPFTVEELGKLRSYTQQAEDGRIFTPEQAIEYKQLSERASREYAGQDWASELLKAALFIFALYALGQILRAR